MSRWKATEPIRIKYENARGHAVWESSIHYQRDDRSWHYHMIEVHGDSYEMCKQLSKDIVGYLRTTEMCGVSFDYHNF